ncbi:DcaP family trimeric outer membrane transporter [Shewanella youngdeokensis]|uniref:DcaP family trimeric outer membrane transporter n=1 Tax=Shewanella youngdeokensis TaxID=2999068 RepID=A0ABZ0JVQ4_9GAMM|nr:DcaP family trimeric outer membrane transporter [Shewanella sp. DAU334]
MFNTKVNKTTLLLALSILSAPALASYEFEIDEDSKISFGGYIKVDARYVDGDVAYLDKWSGNGTVLTGDASQFKIFANQSRFNTKYVHGDVTGFIEMDFFGGSGNEVISNSYNPRLRHAYIKYQDLLVGQTWSTFMNTSAMAETADFGGTMMGIAFIRQGQIRYSFGNLQVALENPETSGGDTASDNVPDVIAKYTFKGDWGNVSISGVGRQLNTLDGETETTFGGGFAGKIKTFGKDDLRFQFHTGQLGRYVGTSAVKDLVAKTVDDVTTYDAEESTAYNVSYRHFWTSTLRSTVTYGYIKGDESGTEISQWGLNLFENLTPELAVAVEVGNYQLEHLDADSYYGQLSMQYKF